jgi:HEAT repeat protein
MRIAFGAVLLGVGLVIGFAAGQQPGEKKKPRKGPLPKDIRGRGDADAVGTTQKVAGKTLDDYIKELRSEDASKRSMAIIAISQFGGDSARAVPAVLDRLHDTDVSPRAKALIALRVMAVSGKHVEAVIERVARRLCPYTPRDQRSPGESQAVIRYEAAVTLYRFLNDAPLASMQVAIPWLCIGAMDRASWEIRQICVSLLWRVGQVSKEAPDAGCDTQALQTLINLVNNEKTYQVRLAALQGLAMIGKPADQAMLNKTLSTLTACAGAKNKPLAVWAFAALVSMTEGVASEASLKSISKFLGKEHGLELRSQAAQALGALGPRARSRIPALLDMLTKDPESVAVQGASIALVNIGEASEKVVEALLEVLKHKDPKKAVAAVRGLVELRVNTPQVRGAMEEVLKSTKDSNLRQWISDGLEVIKKPKK